MNVDKSFPLEIRMGNAEVTLSSKLQVIATIQPGSTLSVKTISVVSHNAWGIGVSRWWHAESRIQTMNWIDDVVTQAIDKLKIEFDANIWQDLKAAQAGIRNLDKTYSGDNDIQQRIAKTIERIDTLEKEYPNASLQLKVEEKKSFPQPNSTEDAIRPDDSAITVSSASSVSMGNPSDRAAEISPVASVKQLHDIHTLKCPTVQRSPNPLANPQPLPLGRSYKDALLAGEEKKKYAFYPGFGPDPAQYLRRLGQCPSQPRPIPKTSTAQGTAYSHTYPHEYIRNLPRFPHTLNLRPPVVN